MIVFIDTSGWLAVAIKNDKNHRKAVNYYKRILNEGNLLITSDYIIDETITRLRYDLSYGKAIQFKKLIDQAEDEDLLRIEWIDRKIFDKAISIFRKYNDQLFSFTDCTSFALCEENNIKNVFAYDDDFITMGYILPYS
ncbi:MAG: uncharacterized protein PWR10_873 [Halanaerobiales bacterium]|nr:uncharacterized protein [Halanaerobiales bacterium]